MTGRHALMANRDRRQGQVYAILRARWAARMAGARGLTEAGALTHRFVRDVVRRGLHWSCDAYDGARHLPFAADLIAIDRTLGVIFGDAMNPGVFRTYLAERALVERLAGELAIRPDTHRFVRHQCRVDLIIALVEAGQPTWAAACRSNDYRLAVPDFDPEGTADV